jgi:RimJ/RimL family protein N-acetyltransferase
VGRVSRYWISEETDRLAVGIVVFDDRDRGRGIGTAALARWSELSFDELPELPRLDLRTWDGHAGMIALARRLGFVEEARFRDARVVDGRRVDGLGFGILRAEWEARYPDGVASWLASFEGA